MLATPAPEAAALVASIDADAAGWLRGVAYAPIATVALGAPARAGAFAREPEGFGFLVPRGEAPALLGCLFPSELFAGRAPEGRHLLHCMLGGVRAPEVLELDDAGLARVALADVDRFLGLRGDPEILRVGRWSRAVPQPRPGHRRALRDARARLAARAPIALAGSYTDGVSVPDSFAGGIAAAAALAGGSVVE
ncbi:MAG: protoporphyrinogen oxidase [Myxococcota bacterium]